MTPKYSYDRRAGIRQDLENGLKKDESDLAKVRADLDKLKKGEKVQNLTVEGAQSVIQGLEAVITNKKRILSKV